MVVHHFPGSVSTLGLRIREAAIDSRMWQGVVRDLAGRFPGAECEIVFILRGGRTVAVGLAGTGDRLARADAGAGLTNRLALMTEPGEAEWLQPDLTAPQPEQGATLTLKELGIGDWRLRLRMVLQASERTVDEGMGVLLNRLAPVLRDAFKMCLDLESSRLPSHALLERVLDPVPYGVLLLTPALRPHFANVAGEHALAFRSLFRPMGRGGSLRAASNAVQDDLERLAGGVLDGTLDRARLDVPMPGRTPPMQLRFSRVGAGALDWPTRNRAGTACEHVVMTIRPNDETTRRDARPVSLPASILDDLAAQG
ncbi:hypothetical protein [Aureimonas sp. AU12]|uniref:hypothetical protein n=1 Tax=Aureimonas sp. AU12 TaxID=1638161 RepID=UPI000781C4F0|nr:hypothetical protein [Aureimonas sp. AU12]